MKKRGVKEKVTRGDWRGLVCQLTNNYCTGAKWRAVQQLASKEFCASSSRQQTTGKFHQPPGLYTLLFFYVGGAMRFKILDNGS